jgi:hypothetical protein
MIKQTLIAALAFGTVALAMGQSNFTIVRPSDGAKVRETVRILFPKSSITPNTYVGIYLGGKFLEAVVPQMGQQFAFYELDTKERGLPDGPLTVEAVLFLESADRPRIVDRSSIQLNVANSASIPVPSDGFALKYKFRRGQQWSYAVRQRISSVPLSEALANQTSRASLLAGAEEARFRMLYSVDNAYANGDGLIRMQGQADKGKDSVVLSLDNDPTPRRYFDFQMAPLYMRLSPSGNEVFGAIPQYFPLEGTGGELNRLDLYANFPLPTLPMNRRRPGDTFPGKFMLGTIDLERAPEVEKLVTAPIPARGDFVGVEWEMGHPCAKIRQTLATGNAPTPRRGGEAAGGDLTAQRIEEEIYFALDLGMPVKVERTYTIDVRQRIQRNTGGGGGAAGGPSAAGAAGGGPSAAGAAGGRGGGNSGAANIINGGGTDRINVQGPGQPPPPPRGGPGQGGFGQPGSPGPGQGPRAGGVQGAGGNRGGGNRTGGGGQSVRILRVTVQLSMTLEK